MATDSFGHGRGFSSAVLEATSQLEGRPLAMGKIVRRAGLALTAFTTG